MSTTDDLFPMTTPQQPKKRSYFDYNSSAPLHPAAKAKLIELLEIEGNASSVHFEGRRMRQEVERARQTLATLLKTSRPDQIIFNSGCTEGNNTVLKSFIDKDNSVITSKIEHSCVLSPLMQASAHPQISEKSPLDAMTQDAIEQRPLRQNAYLCDVDERGQLKLQHLKELLEDLRKQTTTPILVSVMLANNETGVVQEHYQDIITLVRHYENTFLHMDAAQALCRVPVDLERYPVDYLTLSSHKIGGPMGVGALYLRPGAPYTSLIDGGGQEKERRSGTHNARSIAAFGEALRHLAPKDWDACRIYRDHIETELKKFAPELHIWCQEAVRLPNTSALAMPHVEAHTQLMAFDLEGFAVSAGSACSSGKTTPSHVLSALQKGLNGSELSQEHIQNTIRISLSPKVTLAEADHFIEVWKNIYNRVKVNLEQS